MAPHPPAKPTPKTGETRMKKRRVRNMTLAAALRQAAKAGQPVVEQHLLLKFTRDTPLVCVDTNGEFGGLPAQATITTLARRRGKKDDPNAKVVSDLTYLVRDSLADTTRIEPRTLPIFSPSMPTTVPGWSTKLTIGRWKVSHRSTKVSIFSAAGRLSPPPM